MTHDEFYVSQFGHQKPHELRDKDRKYYITYMLTKRYDTMPNVNALMSMLYDVCQVHRETQLEIDKQKYLLDHNGTTFNKAQWRIAHCEFDVGGLMRIQSKLTAAIAEHGDNEIISRADDIIRAVDDGVLELFTKWVAVSNIKPYDEFRKSYNVENQLP